MTERNKGFTLVELIVVIVILGILAATALPRFVNLQGDARLAQLNGIAASMEAAKMMVQAKWLAAGSGTDSTVDVPSAPGGDVLVIIDGTALNNGMPDTVAGGMQDAITVPGAVTCTPAAATFTCIYTGIPACSVTYTRATGGVAIGATSASDCN